jgi:hypothetical protein
MSADICLLCEARNAKRRLGRLGRYAQTCDACEERRGTHLATTGSTPRVVIAAVRANGIAR